MKMTEPREKPVLVKMTECPGCGMPGGTHRAWCIRAKKNQGR